MTSISGNRSSDLEANKSVVDAFILFLVSLLLIALVRVAAQITSIPVGLSVIEVFLVFLPALIYVLLKRLPLFQSLGWRPVAPSIALRCLVLGVLGWGVVVMIYLATLGPLEAMLGPAPPGGFLTKAVPSTVPGLAVFLVAMAVFPALCEETLFRGTILGIFERKGVWKGIVYTALLFAIFHITPWIFFPALALGILFGLIAVRTNSTLPAMICHASTNSTVAIISFFYRNDPEHKPYLLVGVLAVLFVMVLIEFLYCTRGVKRQPSPLTVAPAKFSRRLKWMVIAILVAALILAFAANRILERASGANNEYSMPDNDNGEYVLALRSRHADVDIQPGDVVAFNRGGRTLLRKVAKIDQNIVWVIEEPSGERTRQTQVPRGEIIGKVVLKLTPVRGINATPD